MLQFQFGASADIYSLSIIFFELFSGKNPFPGNLFQVYHAKIENKKPNMPSNFPSDLKELVFKSFSKEPTQRSPLEDFQSALEKMEENQLPKGNSI
jgi:serine/threonine protein kinase